jgi:hypothetical protein
MRWERQLLRSGEYLLGLACRRLPSEIRDDRYREWAAELPVILHDPDVRLTWCRALRMLRYAADTIRGTALTPGESRSTRTTRVIVLLAVLLGLAGATLALWGVVRSPADWVNYLAAGWSMFLTWFNGTLWRRRHKRGRTGSKSSARRTEPR